MPDTKFIGTQRSPGDDVVDYFFRISSGETYHDVPVGITGPSINPVGQPPRTGEVLIKVAEAWLLLNRERGFDPFNASAHLIVPGGVVDYWVEHGEIQPGL